MRKLLPVILSLTLGTSTAFAADSDVPSLVAGTTLTGSVFYIAQGGTLDKKLGFNTTTFGVGAGAVIINTGAITDAMLASTFLKINPALGTPTSGTATNLTGLPISTGLTGAGTGVLTALAVNVGSAGAFVTLNGALGTPSSGTATNLTGLPGSTGITGAVTLANIGTGAASHAVPVDVAGTTTWKVVPDCTDVTGNHINYTQSTDAFSCGTTGSGGVGFGVDGGATTQTLNTTGNITNTTRRLLLGTYGGTAWTTGTVTLPTISSLTATDACIRIEDAGTSAPGNQISGSATLTIAANTGDSISGGAAAGSIGPFTTGGLALALCRTATHNWTAFGASTIATSTAPSHQFATGVGVNGLAYTQPAFTDISGTATQVQLSPATFATGTTHTFVAPAEIWECTGTCTVTPPTPAAGYQFCVRNSDNVATVITLAAIASTFYEKTTFAGYGTANTPATSGGAAGDKVCIVGKDSTHYDVFAYNGTWTMP